MLVSFCMCAHKHTGSWEPLAYWTTRKKEKHNWALTNREALRRAGPGLSQLPPSPTHKLTLPHAPLGHSTLTQALRNVVQKAWALCVFPTGTDPRRQNGLKESGACHGFEVGALWGRQTSGRAASVETGVASDDASFSSCAVVFFLGCENSLDIYSVKYFLSFYKSHQVPPILQPSLLYVHNLVKVMLWGQRDMTFSTSLLRWAQCDGADFHWGGRPGVQTWAGKWVGSMSCVCGGTCSLEKWQLFRQWTRGKIPCPPFLRLDLWPGNMNISQAFGWLF